MTCVTEKLSALLDQDLPAREAARVRLHLAACAACRDALAELTSLKAALGGEAACPLLPDESQGDGWAQLAARLGPTGPKTGPRFRFRLVLRPVALALAILGAGAWWVRHGAAQPSDAQLYAQAEVEFRQADAQYQRAIDTLRRVVGGARSGWSPERSRAFDAAQAGLDRAIGECRRLARARPADAEAEELLYAAYRNQIRHFQDELLR